MGAIRHPNVVNMFKAGVLCAWACAVLHAAPCHGVRQLSSLGWTRGSWARPRMR